MKTRRWVLWLGGCSLLSCGGCLASILIPVFASARVAAETAERRQNGKRLYRAILAYANAHNDQLPGSDWQRQIERYDPGIGAVIVRRKGEEFVGFAAVPGVLGISMESSSFSGEKILFVEYHANQPRTVVRNASEVGIDDLPKWTTYIEGSGLVSQYNRNSVIRRLAEQGIFKAGK